MVLVSDTFGRGLALDIVLGIAMAPASVQMVLVEGENADGALVEDDEFDVIAADDAATITVTDQVISAILGTREGAADAGLALSSVGVAWIDPVEAAVLRDALAAYKLENVMLVSAFLAATALAQSVGGAMGYDRTAVLFVEPGPRPWLLSRPPTARSPRSTRNSSTTVRATRPPHS
jgi:hypothetical protein